MIFLLIRQSKEGKDMNLQKGIFYGAVIVLAFVAALTASTDEIPAEPLSAVNDELELVYVTKQTEYESGDIAFVDYGVDTEFGECVVVWIESRSNWSHCDNVEVGWQTLYQREVPAGTDYWAITTYWSETFAPYNWSS